MILRGGINPPILHLARVLSQNKAEGTLRVIVLDAGRTLTVVNAPNVDQINSLRLLHNLRVRFSIHGTLPGLGTN